MKFIMFTLTLSLLIVSQVFAAEVDAAKAGGVLETISEILGNIPLYITLALGLFGSVLAIALAIPGEQPDKFLQGVVDFLTKFSKK